MTRSLDPKRLLILRAVAEAGSISAGARELGWTQPAVSQHIAALERQVGQPLLLRRSHGVALTEAGQRVVAHADAIAGHLEAAAAELAALGALVSGTVRLAAFPSGLAVLVPDALERLRDTAGEGVQVRLIEAEPPEAIEMVRQGQADLALTFQYDWPTPESTSETMTSCPLGSDEILLVLPEGHPASQRADLTLADLADEEWVAGCPRCREHLVLSAQRAGFQPHIRHETDDYVVVQAIVARGLAIATLTGTALSAYRHPGVTIRPLDGLSGRTLQAVHRPGADAVPAIGAVLAALQPQPTTAP
ncbi:MAG: LysR family transcriptional regulator [Propionibacteriaceae bacterium]|nr:LysR family transcriptional regulator [Propionibacteriaceae bacterium]